MLAVIDVNLTSADGIDERQFRQFAVEQVRQRLENLQERGFSDEHRMEKSVLRVCLRVLANTSSREGTVSDIHRI